MKLLVLSDLHLDNANVKLAAGLDFDAIILAGDLCNSGVHGTAWLAQKEVCAGKPVIYIQGNHEFYESPLPFTLSEMRTQTKGTSVHLLDRNVLILGNVRFVGCTLWTDWQIATDGQQDASKAMLMAKLYMLDYRYISPTNNDFSRLEPADTAAFHARDRAWLLETLATPFDGKTVVITHHAPHRKSLPDRYASNWHSPAFVSELSDATFDSADLWVHGHLHDVFDYHVGNCRVVCNPRGYVDERTSRSEVSDFNPALIITI